MEKVESLQKKIFNGIIWNYVQLFGNQLVSLIPTMVLTRILSPSEYGLIAMAAIFTNVAFQLADGGFGDALIRKKDADHLDYCSFFYFNITTCSFIYFILYYSAPFCASFFNDERLTAIIRISGIGIILLAVGQIHSLIFRKNLEFRKPAVRNIVVQIISVVVAIIMAILGYGVWSLVVQGLIQTGLSSIVNWGISNWRPTWNFSFERLKLLFNYGSKRLMSSIIDYVFNKGYDIIIGRIYNPFSLAIYNRACSTESLFSSTFFGVFNKVTFPIFVQMQDDEERLYYNVRRFLIISTMLIFTIMFLLIALAEPLFHFLYSSKWDATIPFFQVVCVSGLFLPIVSIFEAVILAKGEAAKFLKLSILRKFFIVIIILLTFQYGIVYMIMGQVFLRIVDILLLSYSIKFNIFQLIKDLLPYWIVALLIAVTIYSFDAFLSIMLGYIKLGVFLSAFIRLTFGGLTSIFLFFKIYKSINTYGYKEFVIFLTNVLGPKIKYINFLIR